MTGFSNLSMVQYFSSSFYILELHALFARSYGALGIWVDNGLICGINTVTTFTFLYHIGGMKVNVNTYEFAFCTVCTVCSVDTHYAMNLLLTLALVITMNSSQSACAVIWNNFSVASLNVQVITLALLWTRYVVTNRMAKNVSDS